MIIHKEQVDCMLPSGEVGKALYVSYVDKDGSIKKMYYPIPKEQMFNWKYCGMRNSAYADPNWQSYDHKPVRRVPTQILSEHRMNEILCMLGDSVEGIFGYNIPITWYSDIETDVDDLGFPDPETARNPVNTIAITRFPQTIVYGRKPLTPDEINWIQEQINNHPNEKVRQYQFEYRYYPNEADMLMAYFQFINVIPALTGWNFLGYDWNYLYNRAKNLGMDIRFLSGSPISQFKRFHLSLNAFNVTSNLPMHKVIYDYMIAYKKWDMTVKVKENDTLDYVAEQVLGYKKVQHKLGFKEFYQQAYPEYVFYNAVDTILVEQIDKEIKTSNIMYSLASELHVELNDTFSTIAPLQTVMGNFCYKEGKVIPNMDKKENEKQSYPGAFVWKTQPGIYKEVGGLDFASLYPTTMRQFNISPETYKGTVCEYRVDFTQKQKEEHHRIVEEYRRTKLKPGEILCYSGAIYDNTYVGIIPKILTHYFALRKASKAQRKEVDAERKSLHEVMEERKKGVQNLAPAKTGKYSQFTGITESYEDIEKELERLLLLSEYYDAKQNAEKKFLNSVYGACASAYWECSNIEVAKSITLQGQDLNHFTENKSNEYFMGVFQNDTVLHQELGIDSELAKKVDIRYGRITDNGPLPENDDEYAHINTYIDGKKYSTTIGGDTDSVYIEFGRIANQLNIPLDKQAEFVVNLWNKGMSKFINNAFQEYADYHKCTKNLENLELEKIARTAIMFAKKFYVMEEDWIEPGVFLPPMDEINYKGLEVVKGTCPAYCRKSMKDMYEFVLKCYITNEKPTYETLVGMLKGYKDGMISAQPDEICKSVSVGDYDKWVKDDRNRLVFEEKVPIHVRAAGYYNNTLYQNKQFAGKYSRVQSGDKVKWYYSKGPHDVFAYLQNNFPAEFAEPIDYDLNFEKLILSPLNNLLEILGYQKLTANLSYTEELF